MGDIVAHYTYNAWGNCKVEAYEDGFPISQSERPYHIAFINPMRWKGHHCDNITGFYCIDGRFYDPNIGSYINAESPGGVLQGMMQPFGINMYAIDGMNPIDMTPNTQSIFRAVELTYELPPAAEPSWWDVWGKYLFFFVSGIAAVVLAAVFPASIPALLSTLGVTTAFLVIGGTLAGLTSMHNGDGFFAGFAKYVQENAISGFCSRTQNLLRFTVSGGALRNLLGGIVKMRPLKSGAR